MQADASPPPASPPAVAPAVVPLATADASMAKQSGSAVMLLAVIIGALAVAGLIASMVFRVGRKRRRRRAGVPREVRPVWDIDRNLRRRAPLPFPASAVHRPNIGAPLELQETNDSADRDRIEQMLERLARSAQS
jgi:flagellar basal body-associated protein FliL